MTTKSLTLVATLTVVIWISSQPAVKAGGPATSANYATATLKGVVKFEGRTPKPTPINMAADPSCAKQHATPVLSQDLVTDAKGGLRNVIVFVADGLSEQTFKPPRSMTVSSKTVRAIARRYEEEGLESALYEKPRPGQRRRLDAQIETANVLRSSGPE